MMHSFVERDILELIRPGGTKKFILLWDSRPILLEFVMLYETEIPCYNCTKDVRREGIEVCAFYL